MAKPIFYFMTPERESLRPSVDVMGDNSRTVFIPLKLLYPECMFLIKDDDQLYPLHCLRPGSACPRNANCMEILAKRVQYFFDNVTPNAGMLVAYYTWRDKPKTIRAGIFQPGLPEPRQITCRRSAFNKYKAEGVIYKWVPPQEFYLLGGSDDLISPEGLIRE